MRGTTAALHHTYSWRDAELRIGTLPFTFLSAVLSNSLQQRHGRTAGRGDTKNPSFIKANTLSHVMWVRHHGMERPPVADGGDGLQIWWIAANILNK